MESSKLISLLKLLSAKEVKSFLSFCQSDITYVRGGVPELVAILIKEHPTYKSNNCDEKKIWTALFGKQKLNTKPLLHLLSNTTKALEVFLAIQKLVKNKWKSRLFFIEEMLDRRQERITQPYILAFAKQQRTEIPIHDHYYENSLITTELEYKYAMQNGGYFSGFKTLMLDLDCNYFFRKLKYYCEMLNQQNIFQDEINEQEIFLFKKTIENTAHKESLGIKIYLHILNLFLLPNQQTNYYTLKNSLYENESQIEPSEKRNLFTYLLNYCIRNLNTGGTTFLEELFFIYEFILDKKIILENNQLSEFDFKNIVTIALRLKKYDWAEKFMNIYGLLIETNNRENAIAYNQSRLLYAKGEYKAALRLVHKVNFTDVYYQLDSKILLLKIYYDLNDEDALLSQISALKIFLKRSREISKYQVQANFNFCTCLIALNKIRNGAVKNSIKLQSKLGVNRKIIDITWIEERLKALSIK